MRTSAAVVFGACLLAGATTSAFSVSTRRVISARHSVRGWVQFAAPDEEDTLVAERQEKATLDEDVSEATKKWGLEGGLLKSWQKGDLPQAQELLKKYGAAYLATSISLAAVSFAICYTLVDSGVDVASLLAKVGIEVDTGSAAETAGTGAIAYVVHKAASPIRFVPTVALTPVVAEWFGKEDDE